MEEKILEIERKKAAVAERLQNEMEQELKAIPGRVIKEYAAEMERQEREQLMKDPIRAAFYQEDERKKAIAERFFKKPGE